MGKSPSPCTELNLMDDVPRESAITEIIVDELAAFLQVNFPYGSTVIKYRLFYKKKVIPGS